MLKDVYEFAEKRVGLIRFILFITVRHFVKQLFSVSRHRRQRNRDLAAVVIRPVLANAGCVGARSRGLEPFERPTGSEQEREDGESGEFHLQKLEIQFDERSGLYYKNLCKS